MTTRSASAAPPATPTAAPSTGSEAPWSAQATHELQAKSERDRNYWKKEAGRLLQEALVVSSAALSEKQNRVSFMERGNFYREVAALREKLKRWDQRSWTELSIAVLKGGETNQLDYTVDIRSAGPSRRPRSCASASRSRQLRRPRPSPTPKRTRASTMGRTTGASRCCHTMTSAPTPCISTSIVTRKL